MSINENSTRKSIMIKRRNFLQQAGIAGLGLACKGNGIAAAGPNSSRSDEFFAGIQIGPYSILDEGIEQTLDRIQEAAGINTLLCYSHNYHTGYSRPPEVMATDHGIEVRDIRRRKLP